jgi:hypothetical protein
MIDFYIPPPALVRLCERYGIPRFTRGNGRGPNGDRVEGPYGMLWFSDPWLCLRLNPPTPETKEQFTARYCATLKPGMKVSKFHAYTFYWHAERDSHLTANALEVIGLHPLSFEEWRSRGYR